MRQSRPCEKAGSTCRIGVIAEVSRLEKNIFDKVISLTKGICSQEPADGVASLASFYYGTRADPPFSSGMSVQWWLTKKAEIDNLDIAVMAMSYDLTLKDGDQKTFSSVIMSILEKTTGNIELFNGGSFFSKHYPTLFDARKIKFPRKFAQKLWEVIHCALLGSITEWLILYPLPRIKSRLFSLGFDGISLIPADDNEVWLDLEEKYRGIRLWKPLTGDLRGRQKIPHCMAQYHLAPPLTWLACELTGTKDGALKQSKKRVSKFLSVLFSQLIVRKPQILDKFFN
jgi:hypothetical protein